jgi:hypothetical protein
VAAVHFILTNAAKYDVDERSLIQEIQQLGLPKENAEAIAKQYRDHKDNLRAKFSEQSYRVSRLLKADWRVDHILASSTVIGEEPFSGPVIHLKFQVDTAPERESANPLGKEVVVSDGNRVKDIAFEVTAERLDILIHELAEAQKRLESVDN